MNDDNDLEVKDGVNPNAPDQVPTVDEQIGTAEGLLGDIRKRMQKAKAQHEASIKKSKELRELLASTEKSLINSNYESLMNEEHQIMGRIENLRASKTSRVK